MKNRILLLMFLILCSANLWSQSKTNVTIPLIGDNAPTFIAETTSGQLDFPADYGNNWKIIFSHPRDFTPVCSSEILELAHMQAQFEKLGVKLLIVSTDTLDQHKLWVRALEDISYKNKTPVKINFPLADDKNMSISKKYGMLHEPTSSSKDVRGVFIIDPKNKIQAVFFYPMNVGRNMEEIKRTVIALQTVSSTGHGKDQLVTPANWQLGEDLMVPHYPYTQSELKDNPSLKDSYYSLSTFMWYKKM